MSHKAERLWRLAVAVETAERGGKIQQARDLRDRFEQRVKCCQDLSKEHFASPSRAEYLTCSGTGTIRYTEGVSKLEDMVARPGACVGVGSRGRPGDQGSTH